MIPDADLLTARLEQCGVDTVFGLPGTQNVVLFDSLRRSRLRTIVPTHELAAGFMANGYARASGRVGVVAAIQGPGFTYALTALAEARHDSAPLLLITGAPEGSRPFALQALDQAALAAPLAKAVIRGRSGDALAEDVARAHALALAGEPGPVVLELPGDPAEAGSAPAAAPAARRDPSPESLEALLRQARRPIFYLGQGCADGAASLLRLAEQLGAPVATTLSGRGILPENHPLSLALDQLPDGVEQLNRMMASSDLILALGCKLSHNGTAGFRLTLPADRLVHVDASDQVLGANYPARLLLRTDGPALLARLAAGTWSRSDWRTVELDACRQAARANPSPEPAFPDIRPSTPAGFFAALRTALPDDAILVLDSGQHQMLARRHYPVLAPRGLIAPSDYQSMGFGLPAAIGAAVAAPTRPVAALIGDGGFAMSGLELLTAAREKIPLLTIVFCDGSLGLIRAQQIREFGHTHGVTLDPIDLAALAAATGARHVRLEGDEPARLLGEARAGSQPVLLEVNVGDSGAVRRQHAASYARSAVRRALGPRLIRVLKRWLR